jgi:hypothetical protein
MFKIKYKLRIFLVKSAQMLDAKRSILDFLTRATRYTFLAKGPFRSRLQVRICVRIGVRFGVRFGAKGGLLSNLGSICSEMCLQTVVMGA